MNRLTALLLSGLGIVLVLCGCRTSSSKTTQEVTLENPVVSQGAMNEDDSQVGITLFMAAVEGLEGKVEDTQPAPRGLDLVEERPQLLLPDAGKVVALPRLNPTELRELLQGIILQLQASHGYQTVGSEHSHGLPEPPEGLSEASLLTRRTETGTAYLRLGAHAYLSRSPDLYVYGTEVLPDSETPKVNPDLSLVETLLEQEIEKLKIREKTFHAAELDLHIIQLSFIDTDGALAGLKGMGVHTVADMGQVTFPLSFNQLPTVAKMPFPQEADTGLVGDKLADKGAFSLSVVPTTASTLPSNKNTSPDSRIMVYYHPAYPEHLSRVKELVSTYIDRPAKQIYVEGMVLEISEDGLKELGIQWEFDQDNVTGTLGSVSAGSGLPTGLITASKNYDFDSNWLARLRALVEEGKAEVLSRPGVLTLDNRQATIRVGTDIPIATSQEGLSGGNKISFQFQYLPTGILLNIRPRVSESGEEVSMLVDVVVSSRIAGEDLEQRDRDGLLLARAPTVATRRVQTYARINDRTPFIIGGLVSKNTQVFQDKVPFLGDIPGLGKLFRSEEQLTQKREVIIVLTPYVLAESRLLQQEPNLPKDEEMFDDFGNVLFRDTYRIHAEDVFDLNFLLENRRLTFYRSLAAQAIKEDHRLEEKEPFSFFANGRFPGETPLVIRMIYDVVKRLSSEALPPERRIDQVILEENLILLQHQDQEGGYNVRFLDGLLKDMGGSEKAEDFFEDHPGKAIAITFFYDRESFEPGHLSSEPVPEVKVVDCPGRDTWMSLLRSLNEITPGGRKRYSILLQSPEDIVRLRRAVLLKRIISLNGGVKQMNLRTFTVGKKLLIPEIKPNQSHVIDADVAQIFFYTEHYYAISFAELEKGLEELDQALRQPAYRSLFDRVQPPASMQN